LTEKIGAIRLGSRVCFDDRWQGRVSSLEVDESWGVLNIGVSSGFLFARSSVRLPFSAVSNWSDDSVRIAANSFQAFTRQIPPVAAPARPLDDSTPISHPGTKVAGLVVRHSDRRVIEVLVSRGIGGLFRVPVKDVSFSGKTLTIGVESALLVAYRPDAEIHERVHETIAEDAHITPDDKRSVHADVEDGIVTLRGNVRVNTTRDYIAALATDMPGVVEVRDEITDDFQLEAVIGQALDTSGIQREAQVYVRSNLGDVALFGYVPSQRMAEDVTRTVVRVPGVRNVTSHLQVRAAIHAR
jgi:osmotically-inducible protein OsmY